MVEPILGGSSDVALSADVAPLSDSDIDGRDLLQRSVVPHGACKALAGGAMDHAVSRGVGIFVLALLWQIFAADERDGIPKSVFQ